MAGPGTFSKSFLCETLAAFTVARTDSHVVLATMLTVLKLPSGVARQVEVFVQTERHRFIVVYNAGMVYRWTELGCRGMWIFKDFSPPGHSLGARYPHQRVVSLQESF